MNKMKKTKKLIAATMAIMMCIGSMPAYVEKKEKSAYADNTVASGSSVTSYGGELYPEGMEAEDYEEFGFSMSSPEEFNPDDTSNPLEGYTEVEISELYVSKMNGRDDEHWEGQFKVMDNISTSPSASAFNLNTMDNKLVGNAFSYSENYPSSNDDIRPQTMNSIAVDLNGDGIDEVFEVTLYVDYDYYYEPYEISMVDTKVYQKNPFTGYCWEELYKMTTCLSSKRSDDPTFVADIEANTSKAYTALATGDYDGDGLDEVAAYIPCQNGGCPFVRIYDYKGSTYGGSLSILGQIELSDLNKDGNKFNYGYEDELMPIVSLGTTSISGQDDLVITVTNPRTEKADVNENGQETIMAMYHANGYTLSRTMEPTVLTYNVNGKTERMRFCSVTDADINGNGVQELLVGGYLNNNIDDGATDIGDISEDENVIQAFCWNDETDKYEAVWSEGPKKVPANSELSVNEDMMEPAAFTAARLDSNYLTEKVFLEGVIVGFEGASSTGTSEKERLKSGNFNNGSAIITDMEGDNDAFISEAYAATFSDSTLSAEQIVISQGDYVSTDNDTIYYDICWAWQSDSGIVSKVTNNDYIKADEDDNGTFLSITPLNCDEDSIYYVYKGKEYGWSEPELFAVLESPPYWSELDYGAGAYSAGSIVYTVTTGWGDSSQGNWGVGAQAFLSVGIEAGISAGLVSAGVGMGVSADAMAQYVGNYAKSCTESDSFSVTLIPGNDYAIAIAVPMVSYNYDMWVPEYKVTQEHIDAYNELRADDPTLEPYPYKVGEVVEGHMEEYAVHTTLAPTYTHMTVDEYNELAEKYGLDTIDKSILGDKTIGDPTTYPKSEGEVVKADGAEDFYVSSNSAVIEVESGAPTKGLTYAIEYGEEIGHGFGLSFNIGLYASATVQKKGFWKVDVHGESGAGLHLEGGGMWVSSSSEGTSITANMSGIPDYAGDSYGYTAQMYVYHVDCDGDNDDIYVAGFIIPDGDEASAPSSIPNDLRVVGTTAHEAVLKWSPSDYRAAGYYEIYIYDEKENTEVLVEPGTQKNYYVVTGLEPDTKYQFAIKTYKADAAVGVESALSRYVSGTTKSVSDVSPYFSKQPENVIITEADYGNTFTLESKAEFGAGMEEKEYGLTYQWQKCSYKELTKDGTWTDIEGATNPTYTLPVVTKDNADSFDDEEFYRVKVTQKKSGSEQIVISKIATVYVEKENDAHDYYYTDTLLSVENTQNIYPLSTSLNTYYVESGTDLELDINVAVEGNSNKKLKSGDVTVVYNEISDKNNRTLVEGALSDGYVNVDLKDIPVGDYEITAIYAGGLDGSDDNKSYYLASQSDTITISVVDTYTVNYHLNGGVNNDSNPTILTSKSEAVVLLAPSKDGYEFSGWYTNEELTNPLSDNTIDVNSLTDNVIDVYAKWTPNEYSITYVLNGGENNTDNPTSYNSDMVTVELFVPAKKGYSFEGWFEESDFSGKEVKAISGTEHRDIVLYAKWEETEAPFKPDAEGNYLINTYEDLVALAEKVLIDPDKYAGASFVQTQNINAYEMEWNLEIGTEESPFEGTYDGGGYYILGLRPSENVGGLFGVIGKNGIVKNTAVVDFDYSSTQDMVSGFARINKGTIDGCGSGINVTTAATTIINGETVTITSLNSDVKGKVAGGMVCINEGIIRNCYSNAVVTGETAGGIAAKNTGTILNVYNTEKISGEKVAGGIVGENKGSIRFGYNAEMITGETAGAIAGASENTDIKDMWYRNDMSSACGNKEDSELEVTKIEKADMRNVTFGDTLNETIATDGGRLKLRTWVYSGRRNSGYPTISQEYVQMRTVSNEVLGISVTGLIHNKAQLKVVKLSESDEEYVALKEAAKKGELVGCWKIVLQYPDGSYGTWDDELTVSIRPEILESHKEYSIVHLDENNECVTLNTTVLGENLVVTSEVLDDFGVVGIVKTDKDDTNDELNDTDADKDDMNSEKESESIKDEPVKTGDNSKVWMIMCLMLVSAVVVLVEKSKTKRKE